jgi:hypothetical protein
MWGRQMALPSGFFVASICGAVLILSRPAGYFANADFRLKFVCMALAGVNMLVFQFFTSKGLASWDRGAPPVAAKLAARCRFSCG